MWSFEQWSENGLLEVQVNALCTVSWLVRNLRDIGLVAR